MPILWLNGQSGRITNIPCLVFIILAIPVVEQNIPSEPTRTVDAGKGALHRHLSCHEVKWGTLGRCIDFDRDETSPGQAPTCIYSPIPKGTELRVLRVCQNGIFILSSQRTQPRRASTSIPGMYSIIEH